MQSVKQDKLWKYLKWACYAGLFLAAMYICNKIDYSDGDDVYFYNMAHSMGFFEYLQMRYQTWEGRMTSEAMTYISMFFGKTFWNVANPLMLTLLVGGIVRIVKKICWGLTPEKEFLLTLFTGGAVLISGIGSFGYAVFWVTGSTFYMWSVAAGIWALVPLAELAFSPDTLQKKSFLYAIPCGFIVSMGLEQMAAIVITFGILAAAYHIIRTKQIPWLAVIQTAVAIAGLVVLFLSPGTEQRSAIEAERFMPEFGTMPVSQHIFITVQWVLSGFANYQRWYVSVILVLCVFLSWKKRERKTAGTWALTALSLLGAASPWINYLGTDLFTELGMGVPDETQTVTQVASLSSLNGREVFACLWQLFLMALVLVMVWRAGKTLLEKCVLELMFLASIASAGIMYFSPTMYGSGPRVMFVTSVMLWAVCSLLFAKTRDRKIQIGIGAYTAIAGVANVIVMYVMAF